MVANTYFHKLDYTDLSLSDKKLKPDIDSDTKINFYNINNYYPNLSNSLAFTIVVNDENV